MRNDEYIDLVAIETGVIPANTAVILKGNSGTHYFAITESTASIKNNVLQGTIEKTATSSISNPYILQSDNTADNGVVMRRYNGEYINGFKVYMSLDDAQETLYFNFGGATGIEETKAQAENGVVYDLFGRRIEGEPTNGVYITNGEKFIK